MTNLFSEQELKKLFQNAEEKVEKEIVHPLKNLFALLIFALLFFIFSYLIINLPALYLNLRYWWETEYHSTGASSTTTTAVISKPASIENNILTIAKINVTAPIIWDVAENDLLNELQKGIVHYAGTKKPNDAEGPIVITGHSSNFWWQKGDYNQIFALLSKLVVGDEITITYANQIYRYRVSKKEVVDPDNPKVFEKTNQPILVLVTCTPLGTNLKRLIVIAS